MRNMVFIAVLLCGVLTSVGVVNVAAQAMLSPAATVATRLGTQDDPMVSVFDYSQYTDPEQLLGLPGQCVAKAYFRDWYGLEGVVEVFQTSSDASSRATSIVNTQAQFDPAAAEYVAVRGTVLVRLFGATEYQRADYEQRLTRLFPRGP